LRSDGRRQGGNTFIKECCDTNAVGDRERNVIDRKRKSERKRVSVRERDTEREAQILILI
jgi:hypothetical protein